MITKTDALFSLRPNAEWVVRGEEIEWLDTEQTQPTDAEIQTELDRLQAEHTAQEYARSRKKEYPSIGDQLDMIFRAGLGGDEFQAAIQAVKDAHPKPTE